MPMKPLLIIILVCLLLFLAGLYTLHDPVSTSPPTAASRHTRSVPADNATQAPS